MSESIPQPRVQVRASASLPKRHREPVTIGIPWPKGMIRDVHQLQLLNSKNEAVPLQAQILDCWADGSARWILCDWQATVDGEETYHLDVSSQSFDPSTWNSIQLESNHHSYQVTTGGKTFWFDPARTNGNLFGVVDSSQQSMEQADWMEMEWPESFSVQLRDILFPQKQTLGIRQVIQRNWQLLANNLPIVVTSRCHFYAGHPLVKIDWTITNPNPASHPGGMWDLGGPNCLLFPFAYIRFPFSAGSNAQMLYSTEPNHWQKTSPIAAKLMQPSSGGTNWKSTNHINSKREIPIPYQGYRFQIGQETRSGLRATPIMALESESKSLAVAMPYFWQNFPKELTLDSSSIRLGLFPHMEGNHTHELQGGEQKTYTFYVSFGPETITEHPLDWTRSPLEVRIDPDWIQYTQAIAYFTSKQQDPHTSYLQLVDSAIEGSDTFEQKREVIDEYGWRHFGEIYGDHEAIFHTDFPPHPRISHYNNQYDPVAGFAYQWLRSGDPRWYSMLQQLAWHVINIDIYHTDQDKAAYNHGLFWHTYHYVDADTATHRTYPRQGRIPPHGKPVPGGGPGNEQNYASGLMLHYFLTGEEASKQAAIGLAQWVIDMDDGNKTIFRWLCRSNTGLASQSRTPDYHGPGRGSGNSIATLLDGYQLTKNTIFLEKAEQLIRRCIHPKDTINKLNLLDAENRWFYTMFLQSLCKYLDLKIELNNLDFMYSYAQASLLHYVRWMAQHEYPYLVKPEILEYPTETWPAQDMRKCEIFQYAALHTTETEREHFQERAKFFFETSVNTLSTMPTKTLCRPVVLMLSFGWRHNWFRQHPHATKPIPPTPTPDFGTPTKFIPQKQIAIQRAKRLIVLGGILMMVLLAVLLLSVL